MPPFYSNAPWRKARLQALYAAGWTCSRCGLDLRWTKGEAQVHHRKPLKSAPALALEPLNHLVLCRACHTLIEKARSADVATPDGTPGDPQHPWNRPGGRVEK